MPKLRREETIVLRPKDFFLASPDPEEGNPGGKPTSSSAEERAKEIDEVVELDPDSVQIEERWKR